MAPDAAVSGKVFPTHHWNVASFEGGPEDVLVARDSKHSREV